MFEMWVADFPLQSEAWNVYDMPGRRSVPERDQGGVTHFGQHGITPAIGPFAPKQFSLKIWVDCCDPHTGRAVLDPRAQFETNLTDVLTPFLAPGLIPLRQRAPEGATLHAQVRVMGAIDPEIAPGETLPRGFLTVVLENPDCFWTDRLTPARFETSVFNTPVRVVLGGLASARAPMFDHVIEVAGPVSGLVLRHGERRVSYAASIPAGQVLRLDNKQLRATVGAASVRANIAEFGSGPRFLDLYHPFEITAVASSAGAGSRWRVIGFPKYL